MNKIKVLPQNLANKIAAGEVVERPASVVKELVENALDAQSTRITIEIEKGGQSLIRVSDNGTGMNHDDALLALERYATSKISTDKDLFSINTLGFRGEALPSIAAVSRFSLITRDDLSDGATEIVVDGGKIESVASAGAPIGTMITVEQLFFNTPARRKFLKTIGTEMSHIADAVARLALGYPKVQFRLIHNDNVIKSWPRVSRPFDRVVDVLGRDLQQDLHPVESRRDEIAISGYISSPRVTRRTSRGLYIFVNGRFVRDRTIQHAVFEGYAQRLVKGQFPIAVVFINLPFDQVDVNVHPTKNEVRFVNPQRVHTAAKSAIAQTLYEVDRNQWGTEKSHVYRAFAKQPRVSEEVMPEFGIQNAAGKISNSAPATRFRYPATSSQRHQAQIWQKEGFGGLRVVGQLHNTYILCESDAGLVLIDQHAAHERILFEQLDQRGSGQPSAAQRLVVPETLELNFREAEILRQMVADLNSLALDIEPFGGNTFIIKAVPALLSGRDLKPIIHEIVDKMAAAGRAPGLKDALDQCRVVLACHGAIRANQVLTDEQIQGLLDQLDRCENPSHCPHGRPTWIRWDLATLEKLFKRVV